MRLAGKVALISGAAGGMGAAQARLFAREDGYRGTELLRLEGAAPVYLTIDRWRDPAAFEQAKRALADEYAALDRRCEALTSDETWLGLHAVVD